MSKTHVSVVSELTDDQLENFIAQVSLRQRSAKAELEVLNREREQRRNPNPDTADGTIGLIKKVADALVEKRSDISDILCGIIEGDDYYTQHWEECLESRHVSAELPDHILRDEYKGTRVEYDTLTTLLSVDQNGGELTDLDNHTYE
jgi:hypothetical protein